MMDVNINPSNAPRDFEELKKLKRSTLLRVALAANIWNGDSAAEQSFYAANQDEMAAALLQGLLRWDAVRAGGAPPATMQVPAQQPMAAPPPQAMMPIAAPAPMGMPAQPPQAAPAVPRQPVTSADQGSNGLTPHIPAGMAPTPAPMPATGAAAAPAARAPSTPQMPAGEQVMTVLINISKSIDALRKTVDEDVPGVGDHEELTELITGMFRIVQVNTLLTLMLCEKVYEQPRDQLLKVVHMELEDSQRFFNDFSKAGESAGKG